MFNIIQLEFESIKAIVVRGSSKYYFIRNIEVLEICKRNFNNVENQ